MLFYQMLLVLVLAFTAGVACSGHVLRQRVSSVRSASSVADLASEDVRGKAVPLQAWSGPQGSSVDKTIRR